MPAELIEDQRMWDQFIDRSDNGTIFHKWDFLNILQKYTRYRLFRYGIFEGDTLIGVIPIFYNNSYGLKMVYSPPPTSMVYVPYLGLAIGPEMEELKQREREKRWNYIAEQLDREITKISPNYVTIRLTPGIGDVRPFIWNGYEAELRYTYMIDLEKPLEKIEKDIEKKCRRLINRFSNYPLEIKRTYDVYTFIEAQRKGLNKVGKTFFHRQSPEYIKEVLQAFPDNVKMYFVYNGDDLLGIKVVCDFNGRSIAWMGNTAIHQNLATNEYMWWELIKRAKLEGHKTYENVGAGEKRLNFAKTKFNPVLVPCFNILKKDIFYKTAKSSMTKIENAIGLFRGYGMTTPKGTLEAGKVEM